MLDNYWKFKYKWIKCIFICITKVNRIPNRKWTMQEHYMQWKTQLYINYICLGLTGAKIITHTQCWQTKSSSGDASVGLILFQPQIYITLISFDKPRTHSPQMHTNAKYICKLNQFIWNFFVLVEGVRKYAAIYFPCPLCQPLCLFIWLKMRITHVRSRAFSVCYIGRVANLKSNQINFLKCYLLAPLPSFSQHFWPWRATCSVRRFIPVCLRSHLIDRI